MKANSDYPDQVLATRPYAVVENRGAAHLLLQHITSSLAATHFDKVCPYRRRRQQLYCPLYRVRGTWCQFIGSIVSAGLRPNRPPGALGSRPG
ncbi:hypothetical protein TIFTF001_020245 [Ficus carica]|uniref:Uncharacterized protein n=1 Tax=Ficus carica TaxID=3494 RepID=A0AA88DDH6_FICCA|nr:hypothetical protein TIFTF001_020245 [Ficus carica]